MSSETYAMNDLKTRELEVPIASATEALGPDKLLAVEQAVVFDTDPTSARETARSHTRIYTGLPNYKGNIQRKYVPLK